MSNCRCWALRTTAVVMLAVCLATSVCCRRSMAADPGPLAARGAAAAVRGDGQDMPFPEALSPTQVRQLSASKAGELGVAWIGADAQARGFSAQGECLGSEVELAAWRYRTAEAQEKAWVKSVGDLVGEEVGPGGTWAESFVDGRAVCAARFERDGQPWVAVAASANQPAAQEAACLMRSAAELVYPKTAGDWSLPEPAKGYDRETVYDPIDGAADQYIRYHFVRFYRGRYQKGDRTVLADVYQQATSADAYGVQSAFQGKEPAYVGGWGFSTGPQVTFWQGPYFCRIMAEWMGEGAGDAALEVAEAISHTIGVNGPEPSMLNVFADLDPQPARRYYFHMHKDLIPLFYLSTNNLLGLDADTDCVLAKLPPDKEGPVALAVRYPDRARAEAGLAGLLKVVLPDVAPTEGMRVGVWDQGRWAGAATKESVPGAWVVAAFDAVDEAQCRAMVQSLLERVP